MNQKLFWFQRGLWTVVDGGGGMEKVLRIFLP